jgi:3-hydroxyacyl-CoA dehydrogenase
MAFEPLSGRIAVVGTGVIGASWAAYFLARGCRSLLMVFSDTGLRSSERSIHRTNRFNQNHSVSDVLGPH